MKSFPKYAILIILLVRCKFESDKLQSDSNASVENKFMSKALYNEYRDTFENIPNRVNLKNEFSVFVTSGNTEKNTNDLLKLTLVNNTNEIVEIPRQDGSFICVLQAIDKSNKWKPIEFWAFSDCGNSYYYPDLFPPKTSKTIYVRNRTKGNYNTLLRYQLLGKKKLYYTNEFKGKIYETEFFEDTSIVINTRTNLPIKRNKNITLDSAVSLFYRR